MKTALASELKLKIEQLEAEKDKFQSEFNEVSSDLIKIIEASEIKGVKMYGFNFSVVEKASVKTPKTLEEKAALFEYLRSINLFDEMVTIHSTSLNSLYKEKAKEAAEQGILMFQMPGVEEPKPYKQLSMRKI